MAPGVAWSPLPGGRRVCRVVVAGDARREAGAVDASCGAGVQGRSRAPHAQPSIRRHRGDAPAARRPVSCRQVDGSSSVERRRDVVEMSETSVGAAHEPSAMHVASTCRAPGAWPVTGIAHPNESRQAVRRSLHVGHRTRGVLSGRRESRGTPLRGLLLLRNDIMCIIGVLTMPARPGSTTSSDARSTELSSSVTPRCSCARRSGRNPCARCCRGRRTPPSARRCGPS